MKTVGMLEVVDLQEGITPPAGQSERKSGSPPETIMSLLLHDLRSALSAIWGCTEMLLDGNLGPADSRRVASNMHRAAGRMRELIADLGRIARRPAATDESVDLRMVLMASCEVTGVAEHHGIDTLLDVPPKLENPLAHSHIKSVFVNLTSQGLRP